MIKYSLDLTNKHELAFLSDLIADIRAQVSRIDILLVGAMARDLLLFHAHGIKAKRGTEDIDLGFAVASWSDYEKLRESLLSSDLFHTHPNGAHKLLILSSPSQVEKTDLLSIHRMRHVPLLAQTPIAESGCCAILNGNTMLLHCVH